jgi:hypothetical protein
MSEIQILGVENLRKILTKRPVIDREIVSKNNIELRVGI